MYKKLDYLGQMSDIQLHAVGPRAWQDSFFSSTISPDVAREYSLQTVPMFGSLADPHRILYRTTFASMRSGRPDIIHAEEEPDSLAALQVNLARRLWAPQARLLLHTWQNIDRPMSVPVRRIYQSTLSASAGIFCANLAAVQILRRHGYDKPVWLLPANGVDTEKFSPCVQPRPRRPFVIGFIGRLVPEKGIDLLFTALAMLRKARPEVEIRLQIVGGGPEEFALRQQAAQLDVSDAVDFVPGLPPDEIPSAICALSVLVLPSRSTPLWQEQLGRVLLEAMASCVPVIGSNSGAIPEVIDSGGLIFEEGDAVALRDTLLKLIDDPKLGDHLAAVARAHVQARYTQRYIAEQTAAAYRQVTKRTETPADVTQP